MFSVIFILFYGVYCSIRSISLSLPSPPTPNDLFANVEYIDSAVYCSGQSTSLIVLYTHIGARTMYIRVWWKREKIKCDLLESSNPMFQDSIMICVVGASNRIKRLMNHKLANNYNKKSWNELYSNIQNRYDGIRWTHSDLYVCANLSVWWIEWNRLVYTKEQESTAILEMICWEVFGVCLCILWRVWFMRLANLNFLKRFHSVVDNLPSRHKHLCIWVQRDSYTLSLVLICRLVLVILSS